ncbi:MAG: sulfurtransferase TusA family protein [Archangium sp.]|nr:sulfurtransferase TusA family protein [Archangium sp.]
MPIIELARALRSHARVELWADDPAARGDLNAFLSATGHALIDDRPGSRVLQVVVGVRAP